MGAVVFELDSPAYAIPHMPANYNPLSAGKLESLRRRFGDRPAQRSTVSTSVETAPVLTREPLASASNTMPPSPVILTPPPRSIAISLDGPPVEAAADPPIPPLRVHALGQAPAVPAQASLPGSAPTEAMTIFPLALDKSEFPSLAPRPDAGAAPSAADIPLHGTIRERYEVRNRLGSGGYAVVLGVREHASGELRVIKKINDAFYTAADAQRCFREVAYQRAADHPNLLPVHSVAVSLTDIYITCPPMAYDLATALRHGTVSKPAQKQCVLFQLTCALGYMHATGVVHRDLKPANVLLDLDCHVRLCDFGLCRTIPTAGQGGALATPRADAPGAAAASGEVAEAFDGSMSESVGSRWYRAPEVLLGAGVYGPSADMWSLGCVIGELLGAKTLLMGSSSARQLEKILAITGGIPSVDVLVASLGVSADRACAAIGALPTVTPVRLARLMPRVPTTGLDLVSSLLRLGPDERLTAEQVLAHAYLQPFVQASSVSRSAAEADPSSATASAPDNLGGNLGSASSRAAYAAASVNASSRFTAPIDDGVQLTGGEYRAKLCDSLCEALDDSGTPETPADPLYAWAPPSEADCAC